MVVSQEINSTLFFLLFVLISVCLVSLVTVWYQWNHGLLRLEETLIVIYSKPLSLHVKKLKPREEKVKSQYYQLINTINS